MKLGLEHPVMHARPWIAYLCAVLAVTLSTNMHLFAEETENPEMSEISRTIAVQRATQVAIWAMPAVTTYGFTRGTLKDLEGDFNDLVTLSQPMVSRHGFLTANDVTPYVMASMSTDKGPIVVEIPPASEKTIFFGTIVDAWMRPVVDVGPTGLDEGKGGKVLLLPVGYEGEVPEEGYFTFQLEGHRADFAFRPVSQNGGTVEDALAYSRTLKIYPLAKADNPPETTIHDAFPVVWDTLPYYDLR
ncbi:MAG: DUF1254 domain-containing protein, partial [Verrucomicrobiales bacterium]